MPCPQKARLSLHGPSLLGDFSAAAGAPRLPRSPYSICHQRSTLSLSPLRSSLVLLGPRRCRSPWRDPGGLLSSMMLNPPRWLEKAWSPEESSTRHPACLGSCDWAQWDIPTLVPGPAVPPHPQHQQDRPPHPAPPPAHPAPGSSSSHGSPAQVLS